MDDILTAHKANIDAVSQAQKEDPDQLNLTMDIEFIVRVFNLGEAFQKLKERVEFLKTVREVDLEVERVRRQKREL